VLSVGNLTFGGTGKTPFVEHACLSLRARGLTPAILSRGYRSLDGARNDEALLLARRLPDVPHMQAPDRFRAAASLMDRADCFVLDDGFQHLPLHRDEDVVLVDATDPFGGGRCPPGGRLREPVSALARATLVVITRCDFVDRDRLGDTMRRIRAHTAAPVATATFRASCDVALEGRDVLVACGVANPRAFVATVERLGARAAETRFFRDHHAYGAADAADLARSGLPVAVTEKDAVKLEPIWPAGAPLAVVRIDFEPRDNSQAIEAAFDRIARR